MKWFPSIFGFALLLSVFGCAEKEDASKVAVAEFQGGMVSMEEFSQALKEYKATLFLSPSAIDHPVVKKAKEGQPQVKPKPEKKIPSATENRENIRAGLFRQPEQSKELWEKRQKEFYFRLTVQLLLRKLEKLDPQIKSADLYLKDNQLKEIFQKYQVKLSVPTSL